MNHLMQIGPITDYAEIDEYQDWMMQNYKDILRESKMDKDLVLEYDVDDYMQLYGIGRYGKLKGKMISFVLRKG